MIKALAVVLVMSGCSLTLQSRPKSAASSTCSTSNAYWIADAAIATAGAAALAYAMATRETDTQRAMGGVGAVTSIIYLASAGNGLKWRRECAAGSVTATASR